MTVRKYLKLEILISSFKYFRTVRIEKQIRLFVFWEKLTDHKLLSKLTDLYIVVVAFFFLSAS